MKRSLRGGALLLLLVTQQAQQAQQRVGGAAAAAQGSTLRARLLPGAARLDVGGVVGEVGSSVPCQPGAAAAKAARPAAPFVGLGGGGSVLLVVVVCICAAAAAQRGVAAAAGPAARGVGAGGAPVEQVSICGMHVASAGGTARGWPRGSTRKRRHFETDSRQPSSSAEA